MRHRTKRDWFWPGHFGGVHSHLCIHVTAQPLDRGYILTNRRISVCTLHAREASRVGRYTEVVTRRKQRSVLGPREALELSDTLPQPILLIPDDLNVTWYTRSCRVFTYFTCTSLGMPIHVVTLGGIIRPTFYKELYSVMHSHLHMTTCSTSLLDDIDL